MLDKATLEKILNDPDSTAEERQLAQRQLNALAPRAETPARTEPSVPEAEERERSRLAKDLIEFAKAPKLGAVSLNQFFDFGEKRNIRGEERTAFWQEWFGARLGNPENEWRRR